MMMNNLLIMPILIPLFTGMMLILFKQHILLQRALGVIALILTGASAAALIRRIETEGIQTLQLGGWQAPYGISLVADMFSVLLVLTASIVAIGCLLFAFRTIGRERESNYFYPLVLFLITGVNGSFLTGDLFNLYVFFELLLIASYVLVSLGGTKIQLREAMTYVIINVISSSFFLVAIGYLYSMAGTLNLAHLSLRVEEAGQDGLLTAAALLLLMVLAIKAGLFLFYWLPGAYSAPPAAAAALFAALLTKVGIYAIIRIFTLVFVHHPQITHMAIGILAALTMLLGGLGASGYWDIKKILTYNVIIGAGFILAGLAAFSLEGLAGSVYYLIHDMISKALVFLIGGTMIHLTGTSDLKNMSGLIRTHPVLGWIFFTAAMALAGIPPLSGFLGKVYIIAGTFESGSYWLGGIGLFASMMILYSVLKIFMNAFWGETVLSKEEEKGTTKGLMLPIVAFAAFTVILGAGAEWFFPYAEMAAKDLLNPDLYIDAVFAGNPVP
jgi:multicomponent Na+:H+ antiporter subunit D